MKMNRRNVLVGIGAIVAGGGAALGTGAFSQVQADRSVSVQLESDSQALVALATDSSYVTENANGAIEIDLSNVNVDATTTVDSAFTIENNHDEEITLDGPWSVSQNNIDVTLTPDSNTLGTAAAPTSVELVVDTSGASSSDSLNETITIEAST